MPENKTLYITAGVVVGVLILIISLIGTSLEKLDSDEVGLKYDTISKILSGTPMLEGLHVGPPGFMFVKFPSVFDTFKHDLKCLNKDGVRIFLSISYQFRVRPKQLEHIVRQFRDYAGFKNVLKPIGESAMHDACSHYNTSQFQAERGIFQEDVRKRVVDKYDKVSCEVTDLQVNDIRRPKQYEDAVRDKESAREEIEVAKNERPRLLTKANTERKESLTQAEILTDKAKSESRISENKAAAEAKGILNEYQEEARTYKNLMRSNRMNTNSFLAYMGIRAMEHKKSPVMLGMDAPAKTNWAV